MAELIPIEYRIQGLRQKLIVRWSMLAALMGVVCGGGITYAYRWRSEQFRRYDIVAEDHQKNSLKIAEGQQKFNILMEKADRITKLKQLANDQVLISLLSTVSTCVSPNDCIYFLSIQARPKAQSAAATQEKAFKYEMHIAGYTVSQPTYSAFYSRLHEAGGKNAASNVTPFDIKPDWDLSAANFLDGSLKQFRVDCERPSNPG